MTPILNRLIGTNGWRSTLVIVGIATYIIGIPLSLVVRHRPEPYGYLPDNALHRNQRESEEEKDRITTEQEASAVREIGVREALKDRNFWLMMIFGFGTSFSITATTVHLMPFLTSVGITEGLAALTMLGITGSSLIGRLGFAWLGDKHSKKHLLAMAATLQTIGVFIFAHITSPWMIIPFLLTFGPGYGGPIPLQPALQADYFGTKAFASLRGVYSISWTIPGIIGPLLAGWIYDVQGSYKLAFIIFAILCSLAVPAILMVRPAKPVPTDL